MSLYIKLFTNFWNHRKTAKLRSLIGNDALWIVPRIWSYAAENQPNGDFSSYSETELCLLLGYNGDAQAMLQALQQAGFLDEMKIHDWKEHNEYHQVFSKRAKKAAKAKWDKVRDKRREEKIGDDKRQALHQACFKHKFEKPSISELEEYSKSINFSLNAQKFLDYYDSKGWRIGNSLMKDWKAAVRNWKSNQNNGQRSPVTLKTLPNNKNPYE